MDFLNKIPKGLVIFLLGILMVTVLAWGYATLSKNQTSAGLPSGTSFFNSLFPFGSAVPAPAPVASSTGTAIPEHTGGVPLLRHVATAPVSGAWFAAPAASSTAPLIRYMDRESGNIEETPADSFATTRISNTTFPGVEELYAAGDSSLIVRTLSDAGEVRNYFGAVHATSSLASTDFSALTAFNRVAVSGEKMFTLTETPNGSTATLENIDGTHAETLLSSAIASWVPLIAASHEFLETAPTAAAEGYLYDVSNGSLAKVAGGLTGFTAIVSPSARYVAYGGSARGVFSFAVLDTKTGTFYPNPLHAFPLKCAFIPNNEPLLFCAVPAAGVAAAYPDDWLLGNVSLSDEAWIVNPVKNTSYFIGALADENNAGIDAENVSVDPSGSYALFMNKKDLSPWSLSISDVAVRAAE